MIDQKVNEIVSASYYNCRLILFYGFKIAITRYSPCKYHIITLFLCCCFYTEALLITSKYVFTEKIRRTYEKQLYINCLK